MHLKDTKIIARTKRFKRQPQKMPTDLAFVFADKTV